MMRIAILLATLTFAASCDGESSIEHASADFPAVLEGQELMLTYEGTQLGKGAERPTPACGRLRRFMNLITLSVAANRIRVGSLADVTRRIGK